MLLNTGPRGALPPTAPGGQRSGQCPPTHTRIKGQCRSKKTGSRTPGLPRGRAKSRSGRLPGADESWTETENRWVDTVALNPGDPSRADQDVLLHQQNRSKCQRKKLGATYASSRGSPNRKATLGRAKTFSCKRAMPRGHPCGPGGWQVGDGWEGSRAPGAHGRGAGRSSKGCCWVAGGGGGPSAATCSVARTHPRSHSDLGRNNQLLLCP